jgi:hypothetical protein
MQHEPVDNVDNWDDAIRKLVNNDENAVNNDDPKNSIDNPQVVDSNNNDIESDKSEIKKEMQDTQMSFKVVLQCIFPVFVALCFMCEASFIDMTC